MASPSARSGYWPGSLSHVPLSPSSSGRPCSSTGATLARAVEAVDEAVGAGARLIVFPEAFIPGYRRDLAPAPRSDMALTNNCTHGCAPNRSISRRRLAPLREAAARRGVTIVCGVQERDSEFSRSTLYNTVVTIARRHAVEPPPQGHAHQPGAHALGSATQRAEGRGHALRPGRCADLLGELHAAGALRAVCAGHRHLPWRHLMTVAIAAPPACSTSRAKAAAGCWAAAAPSRAATSRRAAGHAPVVRGRGRMGQPRRLRGRRAGRKIRIFSYTIPCASCRARDDCRRRDDHGVAWVDPFVRVLEQRGMAGSAAAMSRPWKAQPLPSTRSRLARDVLHAGGAAIATVIGGRHVDVDALRITARSAPAACSSPSRSAHRPAARRVHDLQPAGVAEPQSMRSGLVGMTLRWRFNSVPSGRS